MRYTSAHRKIDRLAEAKARRRPKPPDPGELAAKLWDRAHRIHAFMVAQIDMGVAEAHEVSPVEEIYRYLLKLGEERKEHER